MQQLKEHMRQYQEEFGVENLFQYKSRENKREIRTNLERLSLCVEMGNWTRAEQFAESIKKLCEQAPKEVKGQVFKLLMVVRKEDYEKSVARQKELMQMLEEE